MSNSSKELRAGTNEALGVLGDRIRALDNAIAGLQPHNRALVEDGVVRAAQAFPKACTKCGAINKGFASPAAELCNGCSNELAAPCAGLTGQETPTNTKGAGPWRTQ